MEPANKEEQENQPVSAQPILHEESAGTIALYLGSGELQSRMREDAPDDLVLDYTRTMMSFLLCHPTPRRVVMIGLGGGSMPKWCYRHLPQADITIVEISPQIIALRDRFRIPADDHRFRILCEDGAHYVATATNPTDVLVIDGFDADGQPPELCSQNFYDDCHRMLSPEGLLIANLCDPQDQTHIARIRKSFVDRLRVVSFEDGENKIVFATK